MNVSNVVASVCGGSYFLQTLSINENRLNWWEKGGVCVGAVLSGLAADANLGVVDESAVFLTIYTTRNYGLAKLVIDHLTTLNQSWAFPPGWRWQAGLIMTSVLLADLNNIFGICALIAATVGYYFKLKQNEVDAQPIQLTEEDKNAITQRLMEIDSKTFQAIREEGLQQAENDKKVKDCLNSAIGLAVFFGVTGLARLPRQLASIAVSGIGGCVGYVVSHEYITADAASGFFRGAGQRVQTAYQAMRDRFF